MSNNVIIELEKKYHLDPGSVNALHNAMNQAEDHVGTEHLLWGVMFDDKVREVLRQVGVNVGTLVVALVWYFSQDDNMPATLDGKLTKSTLHAIQAADGLRAVEGEEYTLPIHLLLGMLSIEVGGGFIQLWKVLTGAEPDQQTRDQNKAELARKIKDILKAE